MTERKISPLNGLYRKTTRAQAETRIGERRRITTEMRWSRFLRRWRRDLSRVAGKFHTDNLRGTSYSSAAEERDPCRNRYRQKLELRQKSSGCARGWSEHIGIDRLVVFRVAAQPPAMNHTRGIAAGLLIVGMFLGIELFPKAPDECRRVIVVSRSLPAAYSVVSGEIARNVRNACHVARSRVGDGDALTSRCAPWID